MKISSLYARQVLDSRANPTVEVDLVLEDNSFGRASVPSGASTGTYEARELRDLDSNIYNGKGVLRAVENINGIIKDAIKSKTFDSQKSLDNFLIELDGTEQKSKIGANAILGVSMAFLKACSASRGLYLFQYINQFSDSNVMSMPLPMMNILNGGKHADSNVDIQEFMIAPIKQTSFHERLRMGVEVYHNLKKLLVRDGLSTSVGDEGGYAPNLKNNEEAILYILEAIKNSNYIPGEDVSICLDVASSELFENGNYFFKGENRLFSSLELINYYKDLASKYPLIFIEDGLAEDDFDGWATMTKNLNSSVITVGDDLYVTNINRLKKGISKSSSNAILIKLNQIGTVSETIDVVNYAHKNNIISVISHRSGETEDTTIADLAVGLNSGYIKTGAPARTDRVAKYNQLLRIEEILDKA